ncbi:hypothetical protein LEP1GSC082_2070 [Leptospira kirschneri str. H2]|uniref:Uncharacterized protein n=1 Tax=Leptospira kirschneri str. H1 TaxID=1049966 RepID=A0A0E2AX96_9LEPT|nr:hypothetical protein LEP1GSC081_0137 [Leptospira kirschneri str. H1]EKO60421.1 hypothetical protein LEP1GSC082_2070 [Leptospira kirschneri str. H2]
MGTTTNRDFTVKFLKCGNYYSEITLKQSQLIESIPFL